MAPISYHARWEQSLYHHHHCHICNLGYKVYIPPDVYQLQLHLPEINPCHTGNIVPVM